MVMPSTHIASERPDFRSLPQVDGVSIHYKEATAGLSDAAPPLTIVMLHGFNGSVFNWRLVMQPLADRIAAEGGAKGGCRVIAFDRPPFGLSERPLSWATEAQNPYKPAAGKYGLLLWVFVWPL